MRLSKESFSSNILFLILSASLLFLFIFISKIFIYTK
nr:MAG TPA: hypothetical protein [Caudoviricetes sp.]